MLRNLLEGWKKKRAFKKARKTVSEYVSRTPDAPHINAKRSHLVFLYDCREWKSLHDLLEGFYGRGFTVSNMEAFENNNTGRVIAFNSHNGALPKWTMCQANNPGAPLRGELWLVPSKAIFELDKFYANGVMYRRVLIDVMQNRHKSYKSLTHDRTHVTDDVQRVEKAWVYLGIPEAWDVDAGFLWKPLQLRKSKNKEPHVFYYHSYRSDPLVHPS